MKPGCDRCDAHAAFQVTPGFWRKSYGECPYWYVCGRHLVAVVREVQKGHGAALVSKP